MTTVKLCGLRTPQDIEAAVCAQADLAGCIVEVPGARRSISVGELRKLSKVMGGRIPLVGVFVDTPVEVVAALVVEGVIQMVQLHGNQSAVYVGALRSQAPGVVIIRAAGVTSESCLGETFGKDANFLLLDTPGGGSGTPFDHRMLSGSNLSTRTFIAGGLTPENVTHVICAFHPFGVDTSSGIETEGNKDPEKMKEFVAAVRSADMA